VVEGLEPGRRFQLQSDVTTIGRGPENHVALPSPAVSTAHARVVVHDGQFWIEDLHSTNGVVVNSSAVSADAPRLLSNGDAIRVSDHLLLFHHAGAQFASSSASIEIDRAEVARQVEQLLKLVPEPPPTPQP
jgi:pSer/pThr/pTyr-binding forkhead associated (FHA) protein